MFLHCTHDQDQVLCHWAHADTQADAPNSITTIASVGDKKKYTLQIPKIARRESTQQRLYTGQAEAEVFPFRWM